MPENITPAPELPSSIDAARHRGEKGGRVSTPKRDTRWQTQLFDFNAHFDPKKGWEAATGGTGGSHGKRAARILKGATYATMFAYLWRRFGPPPNSSDPYKELVNYWLTTPVPGIYFGLSCSLSFASGCGVSYCLSPEWAEKARDIDTADQDRWLRGLARHLICDNEILVYAIHRHMSGSDDYNLQIQAPSWLAQARRLYHDYVLEPV
jgi:hypothetical protein